jgi:hypothetical protein
MRVISFSDARSSLKKVIDQVVDDADVAVISRRDAPDGDGRYPEIGGALTHFTSVPRRQPIRNTAVP